jgi:tetratricopeptide (TPR) repeat protein
VVVIDDLQWAEPVFVDLVEHIADLSRDAPIFLLCIARTELLDVRPGWGGGKLNATSLLLEPLGVEECDELMERLDARIDDSLRERIRVASAGNPLYVEEMLAMVREHGGEGDIAVPPTIHALLQARIDSLDGDERVVMERGAVEGEVFHRGTIAELAPPTVRDGVAAHLATLVRKELIRSTAPQFPEDEGFRFRHLLIRDAAYESLPKATRAELHERFADWLSHHDLVESDEIVGYHLEQAHGYRAELDASDLRLADLAGRAAGHLVTAGEGALQRGDYNAGRTLLRRAHALAPDDDRGLALIPDLAIALWESGELDEAQRLLADGRAAPSPVVAAMSAIVDDIFDVLTTNKLTTEQRAERREQARDVIEAAGDDRGLALYWWAVAGESWHACLTEDTVEACEKALRHLELCGAHGQKDDLVAWIAAACVFGPRPVSEGLERIASLEVSLKDATILQAGLWSAKSRLLVMRGDIDEGRELNTSARKTLREAGLFTASAGVLMGRGWIEERADDSAAAERAMREGMDEFERLNDRGFRSTLAVNLADFLLYEGRVDEAREVTALARELTAPDDVTNLVHLHFLDGALLAHDGWLEDAETEGRRAVDLADTTDHVDQRATARVYLAITLARAGRRAEAVSLANEGLALIEAKGDVTGHALARRRLERGGVDPSSDAANVA